MDKIVDIQLRERKHPLRHPYRLSFTILEYYVSFEVGIITESGLQTHAEVVPLPGYNDENHDMIWQNLNGFKKHLNGMTTHAARNALTTERIKTPFSVTPFLTAIDLLEMPQILNFEIPECPQVVIPAFVLDSSQMKTVFEKCERSGRTMKIKLSGKISEDISALNHFDDIRSSKGIKLRMDANQAYNLVEAKQLYKSILKMSLKDDLEYVEQPLPTNNWEDVKHLVHDTMGVHTLLDESILVQEDIDRAKQIGISKIKLKLFKQGGIAETMQQAKYAKSKGMDVVLGNGVATLLSNRIELYLYDKNRDLFFGDCEANGYLKIV